MTLLAEARGLRKVYGTETALDGIDFALENGLVALVGPNGSGKSTLLRLLLDLARPTAGELRFLGLDPQRDGVKIRRRVGVLHERPAFPTHLAGSSVMRAYASILGLEHDAEARAVARFGVGGFAQRHIGTYSAGMLQRFALAMATLGEPDTLLLDEPLNHLDPKSQRQVLAWLRETHRERGTNIILSTHWLANLAEVCSTALILRSGRVAGSGTADAIVGSPAATLRVRVDAPTTFHAAWVARRSEPISMLDGELVIQADADDVGEAAWSVARASGVRVESLVRRKPTMEEAIATILERE